MNIECYGQGKFGHKEDCKICIAKAFCRSAKNPPMLCYQTGRHVPYDEVCEILHLKSSVDHPSQDESNRKIYSQNDLIEVIGFLMALDIQTLDMLDEKISDPGISFSEIARRRGVSRQAVHKFIKKKCEQIPKLKAVLQNYSQKKKKKLQHA